MSAVAKDPATERACGDHQGSQLQPAAPHNLCRNAARGGTCTECFAAAREGDSVLPCHAGHDAGAGAGSGSRRLSVMPQVKVAIVRRRDGSSAPPLTEEIMGP